MFKKILVLILPAAILGMDQKIVRKINLETTDLGIEQGDD